MIQIDCTKQVYIKFMDHEYIQEILRTTNRLAEYKHVTGEISQVRVDFAGMGTHRVKIANLPQKYKKVPSAQPSPNKGE